MKNNNIKKRLFIIYLIITGLVNDVPTNTKNAIPTENAIPTITKNATAITKVTPNLNQPSNACFSKIGTGGIFFVLAIISGNCFILRVIWVRCVIYPADFQQQHLILGSLSISDILVGIVGLINMIINAAFNLTQQNEKCTIIRKINGFMVTVLTTISVGNICLLTIDRFIACVWCFQYYRLVTKTKILVSLTAIWTVPIVLGSSAFVFHYDGNRVRGCFAEYSPLTMVSFAAIVFTGAIFLITMHCILYIIATKKIATEQRQQRAVQLAAFGREAELRHLRKRKLKTVLASFAVSFHIC